MVTNDPYISALGEPAGRPGLMAGLVNRLHLDGEWDGALALLDGTGSDGGEGGTAATRARILVDRYWWRLDDPAPAERAVAGLEDPVLRGFLAALLAYTRIVFALGPRPGDEQMVHAGLQEAARDTTWHAWATFWQGCAADNMHDDPGTARQRYGEALARCRGDGDLLLESYIARHQGSHLIDSDRPAGEMLLRRSLYLRSALGARPQTAAAQATLAGELPPGQERDMLTEAARSTARELGLTWLTRQLAEIAHPA
jgi:hypothetical protein